METLESEINVANDATNASSTIVGTSYRKISDDDADDDRRNTLPKVDRHGFVVSHQMHSKVASLPNPAITGDVGKRRELKWLTMINDWDTVITKRSAKVKERCEKGIPQSVRSLAWQHLSGANTMHKAEPDLYESLIQCKEAKWSYVIRKDIPRTFRHHCMFFEPDSQGQENLYNVLLAYSIYDETVGYNQALAPVAAVLLMHMPPDETFWILVSICKNYLPGYYGERMEAMRLDGMIFAELLKIVHPDISKHMINNNIDPLMYIVEWMVCIFARCLPFQTVLRIWDIFFCEGVKVLFKVALSILKLLFPTEKDMSDKDDFETTQLLNNLPKSCTLETVLVPEAIKLNINDKVFEKIHKSILLEHPELSINRFNGGKHD